MGDEAVEAMIRRVSNWGRWGAEDELGTVNYITEAARVSAAARIRRGKVFSLAIPLDRNGPQLPGDRRLNPQHVMLVTGGDLRAGVQPNSVEGWGYADDMVTMALQCATQWDSLAHAFYDYKMYNDRDCELVSAAGAAKNGIAVLRDSVVARAVLLDVAACLGVECLEAGYRITVADLEATLDRERVESLAGDVLLIRTGNLARARRGGGWNNFIDCPEPGIGLDVLPWLHERQVAAVATDTFAVEVIPNEASIHFPLHAVAIVHMGLLLGEIFDLEELAKDCARDGVYDSFFSAPPLPFTGAVGSPVNPVAIK